MAEYKWIYQQFIERKKNSSCISASFQFSEKPEYVDDCFNRTLVQANADNKKVFEDDST